MDDDDDDMAGRPTSRRKPIKIEIGIETKFLSYPQLSLFYTVDIFLLLCTYVLVLVPVCTYLSKRHLHTYIHGGMAQVSPQLARSPIEMKRSSGGKARRQDIELSV